MSETRSQILEIITRNQPASALDLSRILGLSKPTVQYHVKKLMDLGQIETASLKEGGLKKGRPVKYYRITGNARRENCCHLAKALILYCRKNFFDPQEIQKVAELLVSEMMPQPPGFAEKNFVKRMSVILDELSGMQFQPHWEVHAAGSRVLLRNCPYAKLAIQHPELCEIDRAMLEILLQLPVSREYVWRDDPGRLKDCSFFFTR